MLKVMLTRLKSVHENLRTDDVEGETHSLPKIGEAFTLIGESLVEGGIARVVSTTAVTEIRLHPDDGSMEFLTANSHYGLQVLDMDVSEVAN